MGVQILKEYEFGDMRAEYLLESESRQVGLLLLPIDMPVDGTIERDVQMESLVQLKLTGDIYGEAYAMGNTMRNSETVRRLQFVSQSQEKDEKWTRIHTVLCDDRGYEVTHHLSWKAGTRYVRIYCTFENKSRKTCRLEMFESFSLGGLSPYLEGDGHGCLKVHRLRSAWSEEGKHERISVEDLKLEAAWGHHAVRCERFGQAGSMPVNKFFPFAAVEDSRNHVFWGAQIAHNASWQMELYRRDEGLGMSGGLADREFGHWMKDILPEECFDIPEAIVTAAHTESFDEFTGRLTEAALEGLEHVPEMEKDLPIIFNEYCTTWGNPSHENIKEILESIKGKGFHYFVIDCGWYKEKGVPWDISMGDYEASKDLFPEGLDKTVQLIKDAGLVPGIWFEIENVGRASRAYQMEEHLLHKDGSVLTSYFRRFWDMRDPWTEQYLTDRVIGTLKSYGFGYMKIDYNETIGIGCDGAESLGEGLRRNMECSAEFIEKIKREIPGIVLENCASGGHRLEPSWMSQMSMASFSDAHECKEIPVIAANLHRAIHPRQSQIWAVIRENDSLKRIAYSVANTFLGRMCISGDVTKLSKRQWEIIEQGIDFYREIVPIIKEGQSYLFDSTIESVRHPEGWQVLLRIGKNGEAYAVIHSFAGTVPALVTIELPEGCPERIKQVYSDDPRQEEIRINQGIMQCLLMENDKALAVHLVQQF